MLHTMLADLQRTAPLVHCITNYVTANDCANVLLACGASPIMADDPAESAEITALARGLTLNLGTLSQQKIPALLLSGQAANRLGLPIVLDPVGAGASAFRTQTAQRLLEQIHFSVVRGNASEIRALCSGGGDSGGVDAASSDAITDTTLAGRLALAKQFAREQRTVTAMTGELDLVTDGQTAYIIRNGTPLLRKVTGAGCMLSALTGAFLAANPAAPLEAAAAAVCMMGLCGEQAAQRCGPQDGSGSFRVYLIDAISNLTPSQLEKGACYEMY
ncbi:MAG: hydroxyethylthiazole kinase [Faecalibacterium sp.]